MAERETVITIRAKNEASQVAKDVKRDYGQMSSEVAASLKQVVATAKAVEGSLKALAVISKSTHGVFREVGLTARQGMSMVSESSNKAKKSVDEFGNSTQQASKMQGAAMSSIGTAARTTAEIFKRFGSDSTKNIGGIAASLMDFKARTDEAAASGKKFATFSEGVKVAADAIDRLDKKINELRVKAGKGLILGAVAEGAATVKSTFSAGSQLATERGISRITGSPESGAAVMKDLKTFDAESQFDLGDTAKIARKALAQGVKQDDLLQYMRDVGDAVTTFGDGTVDEFNSVSRALLQIQNSGRLSKEEINQLNDAGIPAMKILQQQLGLTKQQVADLNEGKIDINPEIAIQALRQGFRAPGVAGAMKDKQENTLPGATSALASSAGQAAISITQHLVPALISITNTIRATTDAFQRLPEPVQKVIAYLLVISIAFKGIGGILLLLAPVISTLIGVFKALSWIATICGTNLVGVAKAIWTFIVALGGIIPALGKVVAFMATFATTMVTALLIGLAVAVGTLLGAGIYTILKRTGVLGKDAPEFGEAVRNTIASATGGERTGSDGLTDSERKQKQLESQAAKPTDLAAEFARQMSPDTSSASLGIPSMTGAQSEIEQLEDQLRSETDKDKRKEISNRIFYARRAQRHNRQEEQARAKAERDRAKTERESLKSAGLDASTSFSSNDFDERRASLEGSSQLTDSREKRQLAKELRAIRQQVKSKRMGGEEGDSRSQALRDAYAARDKAREADLELQIAQINAQRELAEASVKAAAQTGKQRESTLAVGRNKAAQILALAKERAGLLREEASDLRESAADSLRGIGNAPMKSRNPSFDLRASANGRMFGMRSGNYGDGGAFVNPGMQSALAANGNVFGVNSAGAPFQNAAARRKYIADGTATQRPDNSIEINFKKLIIEGKSTLMDGAGRL